MAAAEAWPRVFTDPAATFAVLGAVRAQMAGDASVAMTAAGMQRVLEERDHDRAVLFVVAALELTNGLDAAIRANTPVELHAGYDMFLASIYTRVYTRIIEPEDGDDTPGNLARRVRVCVDACMPLLPA